jgi:AraC-like DNA-binding protein
MYRLIQQENLIKLNDLPKGENLTNYSILNDLSEPHTFRSFSIKYVFEGREKYHVNGNKFIVNAGEYLLANSFCDGKIEIDSNSMVKGICIDVSPVLLSEVFGRFLKPDSPIPDLQLDDFFNSEAFLENKYNTSGTRLGKTLAQLSARFNENPFYNYNLSSEYYYTIAENIIEDHQQIIAQLYNINTVKHITRKDLYRRVCRGKVFLEDNFVDSISVGDAAKDAALSEYHFFRLFKTAFGITPQQYLNQIRLLKSLELLRSGNFSVTEASIASGFTDVFSFSKAFKKYFGVSPSTVNVCKIKRFAK